MTQRVDVRALFLRCSYEEPTAPSGTNRNVFWMQQAKKLLDSHGVRYSQVGDYSLSFLGGSFDTRTTRWRCQGKNGLGLKSLDTFLQSEA